VNDHFQLHCLYSFLCNGLERTTAPSISGRGGNVNGKRSDSQTVGRSDGHTVRQSDSQTDSLSADQTIASEARQSTDSCRFCLTICVICG
jgi:hypothetical protein